MRIDGSLNNTPNYIPPTAQTEKQGTGSAEETIVDKATAEKKKPVDMPTEEEVIKAVEHANKALVFRNTQLEFSIHEKTKEIMVKVLDRDTHEVIREIPPEKVLDMVAKLWEMAGILVDERR